MTTYQTISRHRADGNNDKDFNFIVSPNPATEFLEVRFESECLRFESGVVSLVNSLGQTVESFPFHGEEMRISVANHPSGIYFINLLDGKKDIVATRKIIVK